MAQYRGQRHGVVQLLPRSAASPNKQPPLLFLAFEKREGKDQVLVSLSCYVCRAGVSAFQYGWQRSEAKYTFLPCMSQYGSGPDEMWNLREKRNGDNSTSHGSLSLHPPLCMELYNKYHSHDTIQVEKRSSSNRMGTEDRNSWPA